MSTIRVDNFGPSAGGTTYSARGIAKAWVNFNGTGTIAARDSENVSSLTDNGTGEYVVNWTNAFGATDYVPTGSSGPQSGVSNNIGISFQTDTGRITASSVNSVTRRRDTNTDVDVQFAFILAHGDLA